MNTKILNTPNIQEIKTVEDAEAVARRIAEGAEMQELAKKQEVIDTLSELQNFDASGGGFEEISALLALPEDAFALLAPAFLAELEKSFNRTNDKMAMLQALNLAGIKAEDVEQEYELICSQLENDMMDILSIQKIDFIKRLLALTYNTVLEAEGIAKRKMLIPIEFCHKNAQMPTYAHLTDSGLDVYALEDITIEPGQTALIPTGLKCALPLGYELQVRPKSGRCLKTKLRVANTPGTIDAGYRDEIGVIIDNIEPFIKSAKIDENGRLYDVEFGSSYTIGKGEKFAQLVLCEVPKAIFYEVESVAGIGEDRQGGFGSTGVK